MHRIADLAVDPVACPVASSTPLFDRQQNLRNRFGARFRAEIAFAVDTDADGVGFEITLSDHKHGVDFHLLGALDFAVDRCLPVLPVYRSFRTIWHMDEPSKSLINIGDLGKPAEALVNKISDAVGGLFAPWQIKRIAKAEAEAVIIKARGEIEVTDLQRRAMHRFINEEASRQKNIEDITAKALPQLTDAADPDAMENDWVTNFFDKSRIVSDEEMQTLWARVLAGEANAPGTYSKRTVNFLADLDKIDAELFTSLCGFGWKVGDIVPLVFDTKAEIYNRHNINFNALIHLESIGLIQFSSVVDFQRLKLPKRFGVTYYDRVLVVEMPAEADNKLELGKVLLTKVGQQLAPISGSKPVDGFWEYVRKRWDKYLPKPQSSQTAAAAPAPGTPPVNA